MQMMIIYPSGQEQDTIKVSNIPDTIKVSNIPSGDSSILRSVRYATPVKKIHSSTSFDASLIDTTLVCKKNSINVTFYDPDNFINRIEQQQSNRTILMLAEKSRIREKEQKEILVRHLKDGEKIRQEPFHADWMILVFVFTALMFLTIKPAKKNVNPFLRFFLFRGINEPVSHDNIGLFHWQSTILNLVSFIILSLFGYQLASFHNLIPSGISEIVAWLFLLGTVITIFTLRHIVCWITGNLSGQEEIFQQYLAGVHLSYHFSSLILFVLLFLLSYTVILPVSFYLTGGIIAVGVIYLFRVLRLLVLFINKNISIFYLILYLCALEILPVIILYRYLTGIF